MYAFRGDVVLVGDSVGKMPDRQALVLSGDHADGRPPYWVRWTDSGEEGLLFPGPEVEIEHAGPTYRAEYDVGQARS